MADETTPTLELAPITVLVGHAGVGKTNVAMGLALTEAGRGRKVTVADLDVVNPYFRTSDYRGMLEGAHIRVIAPVLAGTTLDTPSLTGELDAVIGQVAADPEHRRLIIDVGGDDDGATTIGRWSRMLEEAGARTLYVASAFRALTQTARDAADMLPAIEGHAHLKADAILNTSNLAEQTSAEDVERGRAFARELSAICGLPLEATVIPASVVASRDAAGTPPWEGAEEPIVVMPRYVRTPWDSDL